jgi:1-acyl-sn-glycerol-3-phosphate acyltransferase
MKKFYKTIYILFRFIFKLFYRHKIYGLEQLPVGAALIAANHSSYLDPPLLGTSCSEEVYYFARASLFEHYFLNYFIRRLNAYPVKGNATDLATFKLIASFLENEKKVLIFPEGIRSPDGNLCDFKNGAAMLALRVNCPVIPVYIHGTFEIWSRFNRFPTLKGTTACVFGKPLYPDSYKYLAKKEAQDEMTKDVKNSIENLRTWYEAGAKESPNSYAL